MLCFFVCFSRSFQFVSNLFFYKFFSSSTSTKFRHGIKRVLTVTSFTTNWLAHASRICFYCDLTDIREKMRETYVRVTSRGFREQTSWRSVSGGVTRDNVTSGWWSMKYVLSDLSCSTLNIYIWNSKMLCGCRTSCSRLINLTLLLQIEPLNRLPFSFRLIMLWFPQNK